MIGLLVFPERTHPMPGEERWRTLCKQAAVEQDPEKLLKLVEEINQLLEAREKSAAIKLKAPAATDGATGS